MSQTQKPKSDTDLIKVAATQKPLTPAQIDSGVVDKLRNRGYLEYDAKIIVDLGRQLSQGKDVKIPQQLDSEDVARVGKFYAELSLAPKTESKRLLETSSNLRFHGPNVSPSVQTNVASLGTIPSKTNAPLTVYTYEVTTLDNQTYKIATAVPLPTGQTTVTTGTAAEIANMLKQNNKYILSVTSPSGVEVQPGKPEFNAFATKFNADYLQMVRTQGTPDFQQIDISFTGKHRQEQKRAA